VLLKKVSSKTFVVPKMEVKKRPRTASADSGRGSATSSPTHSFPEFPAAKLAKIEQQQISNLFTPDKVSDSDQLRREKEKRREDRRRREKEDKAKEKREKKILEKLEKEKRNWELISIWQPDVREHRKYTTIEGSLNPLISPLFPNRYFKFHHYEKSGVAFYVARDPVKNLIKIRAFDMKPELVLERILTYSMEVYRKTASGKNHTVLLRDEIGTNDITILPEQLHKNAAFGYIIRVKLKPCSSG
jgi:hypothetical protein